MAKRLFLVIFAATAFVACKAPASDKDGMSGDTPSRNGESKVGAMGRDAVERALMSLDIEGGHRKLDLNAVERKSRVRIAKVHLAGELLLLESAGKEVHLYAYDRESLAPVWDSILRERSSFPASTNGDTVVVISEHYAQALSAHTGRGAFLFTHGDLAGLATPFIELPFAPTGGAAVGNDTFWVPGLGSADNNKNIESFSLVNGQRGWGYRAPGYITTTPLIGGDRADPQLYFLTRDGLITVLKANNYGHLPRGERWQRLIEARASHGLFVTRDSKARVGGVYVVDDEGVVYCMNRVTGERRWVDATGRAPEGRPEVFRGICCVKMKSGFSGYDAENVTYVLHVENGPDAGRSFTLRAGESVLGTGANADIRLSDGAIGEMAVSLTVSGELLTVNAFGGGGDEDMEEGGGGGGVTVDGAEAKRIAAFNNSRIKVGKTTIRVEDRGAAALWHDLKVDQVVARIGDRLVVRKGTQLGTVNCWTGEMGKMVNVPGLRHIPSNYEGDNLFAIAGDAGVYALFPR